MPDTDSIRGLPQRRPDGYWHDCGECQHLRGHGRSAGEPVHCAKCHRTWVGNVAQHCQGCHRTFANQYSAEKHSCIEADLGASFEVVRFGVWCHTDDPKKHLVSKGEIGEARPVVGSGATEPILEAV